MTLQCCSFDLRDCCIDPNHAEIGTPNEPPQTQNLLSRRILAFCSEDCSARIGHGSGVCHCEAHIVETGTETNVGVHCLTCLRSLLDMTTAGNCLHIRQGPHDEPTVSQLPPSTVLSLCWLILDRRIFASVASPRISASSHGVVFVAISARSLLSRTADTLSLWRSHVQSLVAMDQLRCFDSVRYDWIETGGDGSAQTGASVDCSQFGYDCYVWEPKLIWVGRTTRDEIGNPMRHADVLPVGRENTVCFANCFSQVTHCLNTWLLCWASNIVERTPLTPQDETTSFARHSNLYISYL